MTSGLFRYINYGTVCFRLRFLTLYLEKKIIMKKDFAPKSRKENLVVQELDGEVLIYDLQSDKAFCLNVTSALVWQACDGSKSVPEISDWVSEKLGTANNEDLVWLALDQLKKEKLIENGAEINNQFEGMSRREVVKRIGLSSMVAIPVVASLVAPVAAATASICGMLSPVAMCTTPGPTNCPNTNQRANGCRCTANSDCCSGSCVNNPNPTCAGEPDAYCI